MTRILFVSELQTWPPYGGERIQAYNVLDSLSRMFDVSVLAPRPDNGCPLLKQVRHWEHLPNTQVSLRRRLLESPYVLARRPAWNRLLERLLQTVHPQIVWFNYGHWGHYTGLARRYGARTVQQTHNAQSQIQRQGLLRSRIDRRHLYFALYYPLQVWHERRLFRHFDRILSVSEQDRRYHARFVGEESSLHGPNYVNEEWYQTTTPLTRKAALLVMTGNFHAFQNQQGVHWFVERVWPQVRRAVPEARFQLVGRIGAEWRARIEQIPGVGCSGQVEQVAPLLRRATLGVVPLRHGSGTRFKLLEALACELPLVSTRLGAEGIALTDGVQARLADTPTTFARAVIELLGDAEQRSLLAAAGLALLRREYSFDVNSERLRQIVRSLVA
jgi:glycosyltransferase involved in cell wall biosynthesis